MYRTRFPQRANRALARAVRVHNPPLVAVRKMGPVVVEMRTLEPDRGRDRSFRYELIDNEKHNRVMFVKHVD
jgi:hypothetical protein